MSSLTSTTTRRILLTAFAFIGVAAMFLGSATALADDDPSTITTSPATTSPPDTTAPPATEPTEPAPSTPADDETTPPTTTSPSTSAPAETGTVTVTAVLAGAHGPVNGASVSINGIRTATPATTTVAAAPVVVKYLGTADGMKVIGAQQVTLEVKPGEHASHTFVLTSADAPTGMFTVSKRDRITGAPLAGAVFDLSFCGTDVSLGRLTTGENGLAGLVTPMGCVAAREVSAPAGYVSENLTYSDDVTDTHDGSIVAYNTQIGYSAPRDPHRRVELQSIPSGPTHR